MIGMAAVIIIVIYPSHITKVIYVSCVVPSSAGIPTEHLFSKGGVTVDPFHST